MVFLFYFVLFPQRLQIHQSELPPYSTKRQYVLLYNHSTLINQFFQLILFLSVLISILQNFIIYFQLHSPKLLYFLPIIASFWEIIKCVGIIILLSFFSYPFSNCTAPSTGLFMHICTSSFPWQIQERASFNIDRYPAEAALVKMEPERYTGIFSPKK